MSAPPRPAPVPESLELLRRAQRGDGAALHVLLDRFGPRLLGRIRLMLGEEARSRAESGDFLQTTLLDVLQAFDTKPLTDERHLLRWMTNVARNRIRDSVRRRRELALETLSGSLAPDSHKSASTPSGHAMLDEDVHRLAEALEELPEPERLAIELHDLEGLSHRDVGLRLGRSEDAARRLHGRAMLRLGGLLGAGEPG